MPLSMSVSDVLREMKKGAKLYRGFGNMVELRVAGIMAIFIPLPIFDALIDEHKIVAEGEGFYGLA
jgi:hypothetical protein